MAKVKQTKEQRSRHRFVTRAMGDNAEKILSKLRRQTSIEDVKITIDREAYECTIYGANGTYSKWHGQGASMRAAVMRAVKQWVLWADLDAAVQAKDEQS